MSQTIHRRNTLKIPTTALPWTDVVRGKEYKDLLNQVQERPIIAWFSERSQGVRLLVKVTARLSNDVWMITTDDGRTTSVDPTTLNKALRYLTKENGWIACEFTSNVAFHQAVLDYYE